VLFNRGTAAVVIAASLALAPGCGGEKKKVSDAPPTTVPASTTTTIDPLLKELLLVADDLPKFKEQASTAPQPDDETFAVCEPADAPAAYALIDEPEVKGATFVRGPEDAVEVSSSAASTTPAKAEAALDELTDSKLTGCIESDVRSAIEKEVPSATDVVVKLTATKPTVAGADQAALLSSAITFKVDGKSGAVRSDFVLLRRQGTIVAIFYSGATNLTSTGERQSIVAAVSRKLGGDTSGTSTTSGSGSGSSTSSTGGGGASTTRRSTSTTRGSTTSSTSGGTTTSSRP